MGISFMNEDSETAVEYLKFLAKYYKTYSSKEEYSTRYEIFK